MYTFVTDVPMQREAHLLTVNPPKRRSDVLVRHFDDLHAVIKTVKGTHPLAILAIVVFPEHLLCDMAFAIGRCRLSAVLLAHQDQFLATAVLETSNPGYLQSTY